MNHTGGRSVYLPRCRTPSFHVRQNLGSTNKLCQCYECDAILRTAFFEYYQMEYHIWQDLSMRQYQIAAPPLRAIFVTQVQCPVKAQESVWVRLRQTVDMIVLGKTSMRTLSGTIRTRLSQRPGAKVSRGKPQKRMEPLTSLGRKKDEPPRAQTTILKNEYTD